MLLWSGIMEWFNTHLIHQPINRMTGWWILPTIDKINNLPQSPYRNSVFIWYSFINGTDNPAIFRLNLELINVTHFHYLFCEGCLSTLLWTQDRHNRKDGQLFNNWFLKSSLIQVAPFLTLTINHSFFYNPFRYHDTIYYLIVNIVSCCHRLYQCLTSEHLIAETSHETL